MRYKPLIYLHAKLSSQCQIITVKGAYLKKKNLETELRAMKAHLTLSLTLQERHLIIQP